MIRPAPRAFTLIELLICVAILLILAPLAMTISGRLELIRQHSEDRTQALADGARALARWRDDVAFARRVALADEGRAMQIDRATTSGRTLSVRYAADESGRLVRSETLAGAPPASVPLTQPVQGLRFETAAGAWRASWTESAPDGIQTWRWNIAGQASPLSRPESAP